MNVLVYWRMKFIYYAIIFVTTFVVTLLICVFFGAPVIVWLNFGSWLWPPLGRVLRYVVLGAIGGVLAGALFTLYEWLVQTTASLLQKVLTTVVVALIYCVALFFSRNYVGDWLPG